MGRGGSGGEGIIFQEAEGGGLKRNEPEILPASLVSI